nr:immunoglobulin light chain junction region [Macaca mulatta]
FQQYDDLPWTF